MAAQSNGKIVNYANIARDVGVDDSTVMHSNISSFNWRAPSSQIIVFPILKPKMIYTVRTSKCEVAQACHCERSEATQFFGVVQHRKNWIASLRSQ